MINNKTMIWFLMLPLLLVLSNCGTGGGKDTIYICEELTDHWVSDTPPITADLGGSYHLSGFDADFYTAFGNHIKTITEADLEMSIGSMTISASFLDLSYSQAGSVGLTGRWYLIYGDRTYTYTKGIVNWADSTSGTIALDGTPSPFLTSGMNS